ncbi:ataxin-10 [Bacillus rossius redtenbacheri]|uniref:ataxin-10 n=1 Tax=Bacillus rossius redtenbacheri TaxID=93214 RepID=UPI002FDDF825
MALSEYVIINKSALESNLRKKDWSVVCELLRISITTFNTVKNERVLTPDDAETLGRVLREAVLHAGEDPSAVLPAATECLRLLRNGCANAPGFQAAVRAPCLEATRGLLARLAEREDHQPAVLCLRTGLQFLGNAVVGCVENQVLVWRDFSGMLINFLEFHDEKVVNFAAMVIYNILLGCPNAMSGIETHGIELFESLIGHAMKDSEFALFTLELFLRREGFLPDVYGRLGAEHRLFLLAAAHGMLGEGRGGPPTRSVAFLAGRLKQGADDILGTCEERSVDRPEPREVAGLLELVASASGQSPYLEHLQQDTSLLVDCLFLLRSMHGLGRSGDNCFAPVRKLSELTVSSRSADVEEHPAFGFKAGLVRLLANLCWRNRANQDRVRELDGIPLLLDCCNIDARNPLIIQWAVLAVRNLCEGNAENQAVIAGMNRQGVVDGAVLREAGLTLHQGGGDGKITVIPHELARASEPV